MDQISEANAHTVHYGQNTINFNVKYCDRKTMEIAVYPDSTVLVKAPMQSDISEIKKKVLRRSRWILGKLYYFDQFSPRTPPRCYVNGESHMYLGRQYRLKIREGQKNSVALWGGFIFVTCRSKANPTEVKKLVDQWYLERARLHFSDSMEGCWQRFKHLGIDQPQLSIRRMQKRWGSLSPQGRITLNRDLIRASKDCIDYVVTHELCHLQYPNHSLEFYRLLDSILPDWKKTKHKLETSL